MHSVGKMKGVVSAGAAADIGDEAGTGDTAIVAAGALVDGADIVYVVEFGSPGFKSRSYM